MQDELCISHALNAHLLCVDSYDYRKQMVTFPKILLEENYHVQSDIRHHRP